MKNVVTQNSEAPEPPNNRSEHYTSLVEPQAAVERNECPATQRQVDNSTQLHTHSGQHANQPSKADLKIGALSDVGTVCMYSTSAHFLGKVE
jgi:hypothetical protein